MINYEDGIFYLHTEKTTYAMGIFMDELLLHLYWGKRIDNVLSTDIYSEFKMRSLSAKNYGEYSSEVLPLEFSTYGSADTRIPTFNCIFSDGSRVSKFIYKDYILVSGKPKIPNLPSTYCESNEEAETLIIHLCDELKNVDIYLTYSVFEKLNAITRSVKIVNNGDKIKVTSALSASVDFPSVENMDIVHLGGAWARECHVNRNSLMLGNQNIESRYGVSSAMHNPFIALCDRNANEDYGNVYAFSLVYSGNFTAGVELDPYNTARFYMGINPFDFEWLLSCGEEFYTPETVMVYSSNGFGEMSRVYHKLYRTRLCRGKYREADRFVLINNWEATYFDVNEERIINIATKAKEIGIDTVVLDDGWFGARVNGKAGLGDWVVNRERFPSGLKCLAKKINDMGMRFGLWFEPEMVNPDSELFRKHPDWVLHTKGRKSTLTRFQLTLDLSRQDVRDYIVDAVSNVLQNANIEYVKWDMNRYMSEAGSALLSDKNQGEVMHRYILGLYNVLEQLTQKFPYVLFEGCASGGGRFDPGMLYFMPQVWTSDDSDAVERLFIQHGTSMVYPYSAMGAHVSASPNHQVGRVTPFEMRCNVALPGQFGFELDLEKCTEKEIEIAKQAINRYHELQTVFHNGDCYRLLSPFENDAAAIEFISEDKNTVIVCIYSIKATPNNVYSFIKLKGLEKAEYFDGDKVYNGEFLENIGLYFMNNYEHKSRIIVLNKVR